MKRIKFRGKVNNRWWCATPDNDSWEQFWAIVPKLTVEMFINCYDKNGKKLYEGDIIKHTNEEATDELTIIPEMEIENFGDYQSIFNSEWLDGNGWYTNIGIISNIHDNPELSRSLRGI